MGNMGGMVLVTLVCGGWTQAGGNPFSNGMSSVSYFRSLVSTPNRARLGRSNSVSVHALICLVYMKSEISCEFSIPT